MANNKLDMLLQVEEYRKSGKSRSAYSRESGVSIHKLRYWDRRYDLLKNKNKQTNTYSDIPFVELKVTEQSTQSIKSVNIPKVEIDLPYGIELKIY